LSVTMDKDHQSTAATTITFHRCLACHQFDMLEDNYIVY
jgi:cytochrome c2